jgi:hypothetical protein
MPESNRRVLRGVILAVQEERFRLLGGDGQGYLLTLAKGAAASPRDLRAWHVQQTAVTVEYTGEPNLESGIARAVYPSQ